MSMNTPSGFTRISYAELEIIRDNIGLLISSKQDIINRNDSEIERLKETFKKEVDNYLTSEYLTQKFTNLIEIHQAGDLIEVPKKVTKRKPFLGIFPRKDKVVVAHTKRIVKPLNFSQISSQVATKISALVGVSDCTVKWAVNGTYHVGTSCMHLERPYHAHRHAYIHDVWHRTNVVLGLVDTGGIIVELGMSKDVKACLHINRSLEREQEVLRKDQGVLKDFLSTGKDCYIDINLYNRVYKYLEI